MSTCALSSGAVRALLFDFFLDVNGTEDLIEGCFILNVNGAKDLIQGCFILDVNGTEDLIEGCFTEARGAQ